MKLNIMDGFFMKFYFQQRKSNIMNTTYEKEDGDGEPQPQIEAAAPMSSPPRIEETTVSTANEI